MPRNRSRWATIDTSALCALEHFDLFRQVALLFDLIHIPRRVREEYAKKRRSRTRLAQLRSDLAPYRYCNVADEVSVRLLLAEEAVRRRPRQDEGEAEAIVQTSQIGAPIVIVDQRRARKWPRHVVWSAAARCGFLSTPSAFGAPLEREQFIRTGKE